jgi:hypothetical protein
VPRATALRLLSPFSSLLSTKPRMRQVGATGFEPATSCSRSSASAQPAHRPAKTSLCSSLLRDRAPQRKPTRSATVSVSHAYPGITGNRQPSPAGNACPQIAEPRPESFAGRRPRVEASLREGRLRGRVMCLHLLKAGRLLEDSQTEHALERPGSPDRTSRHGKRAANGSLLGLWARPRVECWGEEAYELGPGAPKYTAAGSAPCACGRRSAIG